MSDEGSRPPQRGAAGGEVTPQPAALSPRARARLRTAFGVMAAILALGVALAAFAAASTASLRVSTAPNATLGETVAVNPQGRTLYELSPETARHLLCRSAACLGFWPPLTVRSRSTHLKAAGGLHGRLGILRRSNGQLQVTLNGRPLYRYSGDHGRGQANGQGIRSFGGRWHVVAVAGMPAPATTPSPTYPTTTTPAPAPPSPPATTTSTTPAPPPYPPYP